MHIFKGYFLPLCIFLEDIFYIFAYFSTLFLIQIHIFLSLLKKGQKINSDLYAYLIFTVSIELNYLYVDVICIPFTFLFRNPYTFTPSVGINPQRSACTIIACLNACTLVSESEVYVPASRYASNYESFRCGKLSTAFDFNK